MGCVGFVGSPLPSKTSAAASSTKAANSSVAGVNQTSILSPSAASLNFNSVNVGSNSTRSITLNGSGSATTITGVSVSGAGFSTSGVSAGLILQGGQSATLNVTFAPAAAGGANGSVTIVSTADNASFGISLSGTGAGAQAAAPAVGLNWDASSSSVVGYDVFRSTISGSGYTQLNSSPVNGTQYTDTTAQAGQTYYYVVTAVNSSGEQSTYSNQSIISVP